MYIVSKKKLRTVWKKLRDCLASVESSTSTVEITNNYAAHFFDMYVNNHDGKHMLNLPFLLPDLIEPEIYSSYLISYPMLHPISDLILGHTLPDIIPDIMSDVGSNI
jgi:hypothetical protein